MDNQQENSNNASRWTQEELDYIRTNYIFRDSNSIQKIATKLGRSTKSVRHKITQLNISDLRGIKKYQDCAMKSKSPSPQSAYVLGVYLSDGWVSKDRFELSSIDKEYCEETVICLKEILDGQFNENVIEYDKDRLNKTKNGPKYSTNLYRIRIRSSDLVAWLTAITKSKQVIPNEFIELYPKELLSGLIDGDGYISLNKKKNHVPSAYTIGLSGNEYIYSSVKQFPSLFDRLNIKYTKTSDKKSPGMVTFRFNNSDFIKSGCNFKINRKQLKLDALTEIFNEYHGTPQAGDGVL